VTRHDYWILEQAFQTLARIEAAAQRKAQQQKAKKVKRLKKPGAIQ
jgi:RPA family protein